jgi:hypothetical protein
VSEPDVCKGGKPGHKCPKCGTRHQSVRQYQNLNKPVLSAPPDWLPSGDDDDQAAEKGSTMGNPVPPVGGQAYNEARVSPPITAGHQASSTGDHGAAAGARDPMAPTGPKSLALGHSDMRFGSTSVTPWSTMRQRLGDDQYGDRSITRGPVGLVGLAQLDAAGAAGTFQGMNPVSANPVSRPMDHSARNSPVPPNGSHRLNDPQSHAGGPGAMKASDRREILRDAFRRQYGR